MKIAVCDDDRAAREHIISLIREQAPDAEITAFANAEEMLSSQEDFHISFLDMEMGKISGLDAARQIRREQEKKGAAKSIIIFVTGYDKYMNDAFDVSAFHYLLKPINEEKLRAILDRALKELSSAYERTNRYILIKSRGIQQRVYLKDIYYIESANKKVIIHTAKGTPECYGKMEELEQMAGAGFYRCHRCYLVNMEKIASYSANTIRITNGETLILAQKKYSDFVKHYMKYAKEGGTVNV